MGQALGRQGLQGSEGLGGEVGGAPHQATAECRPQAPAQCPVSSAWSLRCPQRSVLVRVRGDVIMYRDNPSRYIRRAMEGVGVSPYRCDWPPALHHAPACPPPGLHSLLPTGSWVQLPAPHQGCLKASTATLTCGGRGCRNFRTKHGTRRVALFHRDLPPSPVLPLGTHDPPHPQISSRSGVLPSL